MTVIFSPSLWERPVLSFAEGEVVRVPERHDRPTISDLRAT